MVILEDGATEVFPIEEFIKTYGADALPNGGPFYKHEPPSSRIYWNAAIDLINAWSDYQAKKKLYINATHPETFFRVAKVVKEKFDGNFQKIANRRDELSREVDCLIDRFEDICSGFDVEPVSRVWLYQHLKDADDYKRLREKCKRRLNRTRPAVSLAKLV